MQFNLFDGEQDGEHNNFDLLGMLEIFAREDNILIGLTPFD